MPYISPPGGRHKNSSLELSCPKCSSCCRTLGFGHIPPPAPAEGTGPYQLPGKEERAPPPPSPGPRRPLRSPQGFWPCFLSATGRASYTLWDLPGTPFTAPVRRTPAQRTVESQKAWGSGRLLQQATWALPSLCPLRVSRDLPTSPHHPHLAPVANLHGQGPGVPAVLCHTCTWPV